jgi:hypothetical protein
MMTETEGDEMKLYKVLKHIDGKLFSPFQSYEYEPGEEYVCADFDPSLEKDCSHGYYATDIDGIIYSFYDLPEYEVWECEVGGRRVEIDQFKRRYERIKLVRQVPLEEVRALAEAEEENVGYKLSEALFPVNPFKIKAGPVTDEEVGLLKKWDSVRSSVRHSIWDSIWSILRDSAWSSLRGNIEDSVWNSIWSSLRDSVKDSVWSSLRDIVKDSVRDGYTWDSIEDSVWDSAEAYISSLYPGIKTWKHIDHPKGENPFQPCIDLWHRGFVPSFDGKIWRLHAGEKAEIVWEGEIEP